VGFQRDASVEDPGLADLLPVGVFAEVKTIRREKSGLSIALVAKERCEFTSLAQSHPFWEVYAQPLEPQNADTLDAQALASLLTDRVRSVQPEAGRKLEHLLRNSPGLAKSGAIADMVTSGLGLDSSDEASVMLELDVEKRLRLVLTLLSQVETLAEVKSKLSDEVQKQIGQNQREAILREQMRAIQKELAARDAENDDDSLEERLMAAELPPDVRKVVDRELKRLAAGSSPEQQGTRKYLELIADLPWSERAELHQDIEAVAAKLDDDHFGLDDVKERILEHLAVEQRIGVHRGAILTLVGPPGVGKTSLGQSIAEATGRPFVRVALGGVRDEAEIRGHRRTYVGSLPGRIISALRDVKVKNPLILLDEIDKLGQGWMGSPEAALLELLDPEQNKHFTDHYLELPFDLSEALFLCTANTLQTLSAPLRDRLEIVELKGYTPQEKLEIARNHLLPSKLSEHGLEATTLEIADDTVHAVIEGYTREAGVRQLSRELTRVCRGVVLHLARETEAKLQAIVIRPESLPDYLGKVRFVPDLGERANIPGVATGLAWTPVGGDVLFVETSRMPGKGRIEITGQLGDVMKESARTALSYLRSNASELGIEQSLLDDQDIHIHVPAGGIPKDGPSAGITMLTALASLFTNRMVRPDTAMTGEITLRGRVLPVGGITSKLLAAHQRGIRRIILSSRNRRDIDEIPEEVLADLSLFFVDDVREVLNAALEEIAPSGADAPDTASTAVA
jgi:ATP-dependent Lon protease